MTKKMILALAVIGVNATMLLLTPKPLAAQETWWGCGYRSCAPGLYNMCVNQGGGSTCTCSCDTPGAGGWYP